MTDCNHYWVIDQGQSICSKCGLVGDLVERLRGPINIDTDSAERKQAAKEIERLRKIVDALTVKLNKELNERYLAEALMKERCDSLEHRLARMGARVEQLRYVRDS